MRTIFHNAQVYTGQLPLQQAFLVEDGHFAAVGTNPDILSLQADAVIDLQQQFVCAGFIDSHMHLLNFGQTLTIAPLARHTQTLSDLLQYMKNTAPGRGGWILGRGWNQDFFQDTDRMPNRWDLDKVSTTHPVCAIRACGHALAVNSTALALLDITPHTPQPDGGEIGMENGQLNGLFFDNAMDLITKAIPAPDKEEIKAMIRMACRELNAYGITSCHSDDYSTFQNLSWETVNQVYRELEESGELTVRVYEQANFSNPDALKGFLQNGNCTGAGTDHFRIGPLKMLGDGALGARTAYLTQPYADAPDTKGLSVFTQQEFDTMIRLAHDHGMQTAIHCIGDGCLDMVLNSICKAQDANPREDCRHGIVHCQITRPDQLEAIIREKLHVYAQTIFLDYDIHIVNQRVGDTLAQTSYNWKTLLRQGTTVSNGSDCPVELPNVMGGIQCAVTRRDLSGIGPYLPDQAFSLQEALDSFTKAGAWASFEEDKKGQIQPGMLADFVVLSNNPFSIPSNQLNEISIQRTYLSGICVYSDQ